MQPCGQQQPTDVGELIRAEMRKLIKKLYPDLPRDSRGVDKLDYFKRLSERRSPGMPMEEKTRKITGLVGAWKADGLDLTSPFGVAGGRGGRRSDFSLSPRRRPAAKSSPRRQDVFGDRARSKLSVSQRWLTTRRQKNLEFWTYGPFTYASRDSKFISIDSFFSNSLRVESKTFA